MLRTAVLSSVLLLCGQAGLAQTVGWYNGKFDGSGGNQNWNCPGPPPYTYGYMLDDFIVPSDGWHVVGVFSKNLYDGSGPAVGEAYWEIRSGLSEESFGTIVASGTAAASWVPTGVVWGGYTEFTLAVGIDLILEPGTYWLAVVPVFRSCDFWSFVGVTSGEDAVGSPPGNNGSTFGIFPAYGLPWDVSKGAGRLIDFSMGLYVQDAPEVMSSLELSKGLISGCLKSSGRIALTEPAPTGGLVVTLRTDNPHAAVPASITFKTGVLSKTFSIATTAVASRQPVVIEASVPGQVLSTTLTLKPMAPKSVLLTPNPVVGGTTVAGQVTLECAAGPGDIEVRLTSTKPLVAAPTTSSITVPVGTKVMPFTVTTNPVTVVTKPAFKATANGVTKSKTLVVNPAP